MLNYLLSLSRRWKLFIMGRGRRGSGKRCNWVQRKRLGISALGNNHQFLTIIIKFL